MSQIESAVQAEQWHKEPLAIVVIGASGDLAKKKTYPSLFNLWLTDLLPSKTVIYGYARSNLSHEAFRAKILPYLTKGDSVDEEVAKAFLDEVCYYTNGSSYDDLDGFASLSSKVEDWMGVKCFNKLFYYAIPPTAFAPATSAVHGVFYNADPEESNGFIRIIVEKPFGRDLESCKKLGNDLAQYFSEKHLFRIDHYLGKEMVQNLIILRFGNIYFEQLFNKDYVENIIITFKEDIGTQGRGGYFDNFGIIRDIIQNHLIQALSLLVMEAPIQVEGPDAGDYIRDAKVAALKAILPPNADTDVVLGQYDGYLDDDTITNKESNCPTFAAILLKINNPRWAGVPIVLKAGKALNERKTEMRVQFKNSSAGAFLFNSDKAPPRNELVIRLQPKEAMYMKTNVKSPGYDSSPVQSELEINYDHRFENFSARGTNPDAYTRLILGVLRNKQEAFVRNDELIASWKIFTPLLHAIENNPAKYRPIVYEPGSRGPPEADMFIRENCNFERNEDYVYNLKTRTLVKRNSFSNLAGLSPSEPASDGLNDVGLFGLAVMGQNFALNMASKGFSVAVSNRSPAKVDLTVNRAKAEGNLPLKGYYSTEEFVQSIRKPRRIIILVQAGKPVDATIATLSQYLEAGDVVVDGGNEWYPNTIRRGQELSKKEIMFVGMGISGGEEGARNGPSLMPGGPKEAYDLLEPIITKCAAQVDDGTTPCCAYLGPIGAGNYVKMVHNGIEYGDMQLIGEVYDIMKNMLKMENEEMSQLFADWNKTELDSYLIEITSKILAKKDELTGEGHVVDYILDKTGMKGTGRWTIQEAAERNVAAPTMAASLDARYMSARKDERVFAEGVLQGPSTIPLSKELIIDDLKAAMYCSKVCSYAQGMGIIQGASDDLKWDVDLAKCATLWRGGCIIRAGLLGKIQNAYEINPHLANLMVDPTFASELNERQSAWRRVIGACMASGISCPALNGSLQYYDSYRRGRLPANLIQAQRDFFGGHTYQRLDKEGVFHTAWTDAHKDIGDISSRTAGENVAV